MQRLTRVVGAAAAVALPGAAYVSHKYRNLHTTEYASNPNGFMDNPPKRPSGAVEETLYNLSRYIVIYTVSQLSALVHYYVNDTEVIDRHKLDRFTVFSRNGQPLVTVSNHNSMMDDPSGMGALVSHSVRASPHRMRWGACSEYQCQRRGDAFAAMTSSGNTLPMQVGASIYQWCMTQLAAKLDEGEWVHLFPEGRIWQEFGKVSRDDKGRWCLPSQRCSAPGLKLGPFKWGVGKLIANAEKVPIVVPYFEQGLNDFLPQRSSDDSIVDDAPKFGVTITFKVGDPVEVASLIKEYHHAAIQRAVARQGLRETAAAGGEELLPATYTPSDRVGPDGSTPLARSKGAWGYFTPDRWLDEEGSVAFPNRITADGRLVPGHLEPAPRIRPPDHHLLTPQQAAEEEGHRLTLYADITQRIWEAVAQLEAEVREARRAKGLGPLDDKQG